MTIKLNGKNYVTVNERVEAALAAEAGYQMVSADTFSISDGTHDRWFYRVTVLVGDRQYIGTAEIKFAAPLSSADGKNPIECAETSALGRALGFAGFGVVDSIASADEMTRGEERRPTRTPPAQTTPATEAQLKAIRKLCDALERAYPGDHLTAAEAGLIIGELGAEHQKMRRAG